MAELKFEEALKKLETIVSEMESGDLSLENSLKRYEEGIKLSRFCSKKLKEAEKKIEILLRDKEGNLAAKPFDETAMAETPESAAEEKPKKTDDDELLF